MNVDDDIRKILDMSDEEIIGYAGGAEAAKKVADDVRAIFFRAQATVKCNQYLEAINEDEQLLPEIIRFYRNEGLKLSQSDVWALGDAIITELEYNPTKSIEI